jgi:hypothetical protein
MTCLDLLSWLRFASGLSDGLTGSNLLANCFNSW